jgi:phosphate transport system substrate-binding protein
MNRHLGLIFLAFVVLLAACAGPAAEPTEEVTVAPTEEEAAPTEAEVEATPEEVEEEPTPTEEVVVSGDVVIDGSSTVYPVTTAVAEEFAAIYPDVRVSVGLSGTGGGFEKFCAGETDISDASRAIRDTEAEICTANGIEYTEMLIGLDGLTVVVNPENDWVECLTTTDLVNILGVNSTVTTWADINPEWPAETITFFVPDPDSGTRDFMIEILEGTDEATTDLRQDENTTNSSDDNVLLTGVGSDANAIGFFGYAYYTEAEGSVRAVAIENEEGNCVEPSSETVEDGTYNPLSRPLYIYPNNASITDKPQVAAFVQYFMEDGLELVMGDVGYSLPPEGTLEDNLNKLWELLGM